MSHLVAVVGAGMAGLTCAAALRIGEEDVEPGENLLHAALLQLGDGLCEGADRFGELALLKIGVAEKAGGDAGVQGILGTVDTPAAVLDTGVGAWVEVRDAAGKRIWGRVLDENFLAGEARVQRGDGIGTMTRVPLRSLTERILVPSARGGTVLFLNRAKTGARPKVLAQRKL